MVRWIAEPVTQLTEGIGPQNWLAPGEVRLFRFDTANQGKTGPGHPGEERAARVRRLQRGA
jgi:hypothetical protein